MYSNSKVLYTFYGQLHSKLPNGVIFPKGGIGRDKLLLFDCETEEGIVVFQLAIMNGEALTSGDCCCC